MDISFTPVDNLRLDTGIYGGTFFMLTGFHGLHIVSGVIVLLIVLVAAFKFKVHSRNMLKMEMCSTYWHFLGGLWLYLFVFLILNR